MTLPRNPEALRAWKARSKPLGRSGNLTRTGFVLRAVKDDGAAVIAFPERKTLQARNTIPPGVRRLVAARDMGLCVHCAKPAVHQHHRRIKGIGGDARPHSDCPCVLVSLCAQCHEFVHRNRVVALAEGLIVPRAALLPGLLPVLVHGYGDGSGARAWPSCTGEWLDFEPDGGSAA
jgi:hypothetical protein